MKIIGIIFLITITLLLLSVGVDLILGIGLKASIWGNILPFSFMVPAEKVIFVLYPIVIVSQLIYFFIQKRRKSKN
ncbi:hypothetical protein [Bacillus niameyensis]|uniref:hypothetical protein n=1 Tax=Bacillus niameyensis TaxID=1522308 RepID=UPI0007836E36|nr:hypothetical protein [Bacillus niameyensis]